ncbi:MAG: hypothetical protein FWC78_01655 [Defluviitaleaceae bacterium]|nr:hypothetical protein [Defluviitaleaceae bacterium]
MKKSFKTRAICLALALILLTGSLTFAAINGSPYETLKQAALEMLVLDNATINARISLYFNGVQESIEPGFMSIGHGRSFDKSFNSQGEPNGMFTFETDQLRISAVHRHPDDTIHWYSVNVFNQHNRRWRDATLTGRTREELNSAQVRLPILLADLIIGDLRHNLTMSTVDGNRRISGAITHSQLPEIVRVGIEALIELDSQFARSAPPQRHNFQRPIDAPPQSIYINTIRGEADIDPNGNLTRLYGYAAITVTNIFNETTLVEAKMEVDITDIGTTFPQSPIPGAEELFTQEFLRQTIQSDLFGQVFFTLNPDGTVNQDSLTASWPNDAARGRTLFTQAPLEIYEVDTE